MHIFLHFQTLLGVEIILEKVSFGVVFVETFLFLTNNDFSMTVRQIVKFTVPLSALVKLINVLFSKANV